MPDMDIEYHTYSTHLEDKKYSQCMKELKLKISSIQKHHPPPPPPPPNPSLLILVFSTYSSYILSWKRLASTLTH